MKFGKLMRATVEQRMLMAAPRGAVQAPETGGQKRSSRRCRWRVRCTQAACISSHAGTPFCPRRGWVSCRVGCASMDPALGCRCPSGGVAARGAGRLTRARHVPCRHVSRRRLLQLHMLLDQEVEKHRTALSRPCSEAGPDARVWDPRLAEARAAATSVLGRACRLAAGCARRAGGRVPRSDASL